MQETTDIEILNNTRTLYIKVRIPVEVLEDALAAHGSLTEYAHLVGAFVGAELADAFEDSGY